MSKTDTRRVVSEIVLNPSFRQQVAQNPGAALSKYKLTETETEFLRYLATKGLTRDLDQNLPPYRPRRSGTLGPPGPID